MLLSQAMLKSAPEMTASSREAAPRKSLESSEPPDLLHPPANRRQRSASLYLSPNSYSKTNGQQPRWAPADTIEEFDSGEENGMHLRRTSSQTRGDKKQQKTRQLHHSPPPTFDNTKQQKRQDNGQQEKKTIRQMFQRMKTKTDSTSKSGQVQIEVHPYTEDPTIAWEILKATQPVKAVKPMSLDAPINCDRVRFVCLSDTHARSLDKVFIPDGDIIVFAGDFTSCGHPKDIVAFNNYLGSLPHKYKVIISGNHELPFDPNWTPTYSVFPGLDKFFKSSDNKGQASRSVLQEALAQENVTNPRQLLTNCIYLEDSMVTLFGLKIFGTPWVPKFDGWAFNLPRGQQLLEKWNRIPEGVDVLITHSPPLGHGDLTRAGIRTGCVELLNSIRKRIRPKYHVFGHIHEGYGCTTDGYTKFINACTCDTSMKPNNLPILFDVALPNGYTKS